MTLYECTKALEKIAITNPAVNSTSNGSIYDFANANPSIKYGVFFLSQTSHREDEYFSYYGYNIFYFDRLIDDLESNRLEIQSIGKDIISNTLKLFKESFNGVTYTELRFTPFTERFSDLCAGVYCTVTLKIPIMVTCSEDFQELVVFTGNCQTCYNEGYNDGLSATYEEGYESGMTYQKSLLISTAITENGEYSRENGYSSISVNIDTNIYYNNGYSSGYTDGYSSGNTDGYEEGYQDGLADCGKDYDEGFEDGYESGYTIGYDSGYTDGINSCEDRYEEGYESGITYQKSLLESIYITGNGQYNRVDGYNSITVDVASSGYSQQDLDNSYNSGYTSGYTDGYSSGNTVGYNSGYTNGEQAGINEQKALLTSTAFTQNGQYNRENGWNVVEVNIDTAIYYNSGLTNGYESGYTVGYSNGYVSGSTNGYDEGYSNGFNNGEQTGINEQKALLSSETFTQNGTYTRNNGWSAVTINVAQTGYTQQDLDNSYISGWSAGYSSGYTDGSQSSGSTGYSSQYLTFEVISDGIINWKTTSSAFTRTIEYKKNDGEWTEITSTTGNGTSISVVSGDTVQFRGNNTGYGLNGTDYNSFKDTTCDFNIYGNIMSLINSNNFNNQYILYSNYTFKSLFYSTNCISAENLILPAVSLSNSCYRSMFGTCSKLIKAPALPANRLVDYCYSYMFEYCDSLTNTPELPARYLAGACYHSMFKGCTSLTTAPTLSSTNLGQYCYSYMFDSCTSLTAATELPATSLENYCYESMFRKCTSLTTAPALPATTLKTNCYNKMFSNCTSLTTAPELPATKLESYCYNQMFYNCGNINYIKCLATNISAVNSTYQWVRGVNENGTFVKDANMTSWATGESGIPNNWTVQDAS